MSRAPILEKYAAAAAQGETDRFDRLFGRADAAEIIERRQSELRRALGRIRLSREFWRTGRLDMDEVEWVRADLRDDGKPDWTYWLDKPRRRYRIRPWRETDGSPWAYRSRCISIFDGETGRALKGVPAAGLRILGDATPLADTDAFAERYIAASRKRVRA